MASTLAPFRARVSERLLETAPLFFDHSLREILNELLQNARRAGATSVDISVNQTDASAWLVIADAGCGVLDPQALLHLGHTGWPDMIQRGEDPAGIGVYSLASRRSTISSRQSTSEVGWQIDLAPEHYSGEAEVVPEPLQRSVGTTVMVELKPTELPAARAFEEAVRYYPVPVTINGEPAHQRYFLEDAIAVRDIAGVRIGLYADPFADVGRYQPNLNFHGLAISAPLPSIPVPGSPMRGLTVKVDVRETTALKLVLPARNAVVADDAFSALCREAERLILEHIATWSGHTLSHANWQRAEDLGVDLPEAVASLTPATTPSPSGDLHSARPEPVSPTTAVVLDPSLGIERPELVCLLRAVDRASLSWKLFEPCAAYQGYSWYRALTRIVAVDWSVDIDGTDTPLDDVGASAPGFVCRGIAVTLTLEAPDGHCSQQVLRTDLVFQDLYDTSPYDAVPIVTAGCELTPHELADTIMSAYFWCSEEHDAGSPEAQREDAERDSLKIALALLVSQEAAETEILRRALRCEIAWRVPPGSRAVITIDDGDIDIEYRPSRNRREAGLSATLARLRTAAADVLGIKGKHGGKECAALSFRRGR